MVQQAHLRGQAQGAQKQVPQGQFEADDQRPRHRHHAVEQVNGGQQQPAEQDEQAQREGQQHDGQAQQPGQAHDRTRAGREGRAVEAAAAREALGLVDADAADDDPVRAEAEQLYRRALAIFERAYGPEHYELAANYNNLAAIYQAQGKGAEAERLYRRALAIKEKVLGPDHPDVAMTLNNLGSAYGALGNEDQGGVVQAVCRHAAMTPSRVFGELLERLVHSLYQVRVEEGVGRGSAQAPHLRRLDAAQQLSDRKIWPLGEGVANIIWPRGDDGRPYEKSRDANADGRAATLSDGRRGGI